MDWVKASYPESQIQDKAIITTLEFQWVDGVYNVYAVDNGGLVVIFSDQRALLETVRNHVGSVFLLRFLKEEDSKHSYAVKHGMITDTAITVAMASVVVTPKGDKKVSVNYYPDNGLVVIE